jgi:hypothetical protein
MTLAPAEVAWAVFQHRAALAVAGALAEDGKSIEDLAEEIGEDPTWLTKKLHGQTPADLGDIMTWVLHYGIDVLPVIDKLAELQAK